MAKTSGFFRRHFITTFVVMGLVISLAAAGLFVFYRWIQERQTQSERYKLRYVASTSLHFDPTKTLFFEERLGLSTDKPTSFFDFSCQEAEKKLLETHFIKEISVKKIKPNLVYIDYTLREPIAFLGDFSNTALDDEGVLFPYHPFFAPKALPEIYVGKEGLISERTLWGGHIDQKRMVLTKELMALLRIFLVSKIDLSHFEDPSIGKREIIVVLKDRKCTHMIRLTPKNFKEELSRYSILRKTLLKGKEGEWTIDLRLPELAFLSNGEKHG